MHIIKTSLDYLIKRDTAPISNDHPITIYSNYPLPLDKLLTLEEQETLNLDFQVIQFLKFPEE